VSHPLVIKSVTRFFEGLNERGIRYAVLRKAELIPDNMGNDIDILITEREKPLVVKVIRNCAEEFGLKTYERKDVKGLYAILYAFVEGKLVFFRLDFTNPVKHPEELLNARVRNEKGIYYLPPGAYKKRKNRNLKRFFTYPKRFLFPPGRFVVILGPDGVGKSTVADLVRQLLEAFHVPVTHMHLGFRPNILPTRKGIISLGKEKISAPGEKSKVPGLVRFFYHALDYVMGYFLKVRPLMVKGKIVLGERYYYSYLVDPRKQNELKFPSWLPKLIFTLFIPKPDIVVLLSHRDPKEIFKRRQEHSVEEIERQIAAYRELGRRAKRFFEIFTGKPPVEVAQEVTERLIVLT